MSDDDTDLDAIALLRRDHNLLRALVGRLEDTTGQAVKTRDTLEGKKVDPAKALVAVEAKLA